MAVVKRNSRKNNIKKDKDSIVSKMNECNLGHRFILLACVFSALTVYSLPNTTAENTLFSEFDSPMLHDSKALLKEAKSQAWGKGTTGSDKLVGNLRGSIKGDLGKKADEKLKRNSDGQKSLRKGTDKSQDIEKSIPSVLEGSGGRLSRKDDKETKRGGLYGKKIDTPKNETVDDESSMKLWRKRSLRGSDTEDSNDTPVPSNTSFIPTLSTSGKPSHTSIGTPVHSSHPTPELTSTNYPTPELRSTNYPTPELISTNNPKHELLRNIESDGINPLLIAGESLLESATGMISAAAAEENSRKIFNKKKNPKELATEYISRAVQDAKVKAAAEVAVETLGNSDMFKGRNVTNMDGVVNTRYIDTLEKPTDVVIDADISTRDMLRSTGRKDLRAYNNNSDTENKFSNKLSGMVSEGVDIVKESGATGASASNMPGKGFDIRSGIKGSSMGTSIKDGSYIGSSSIGSIMRDSSIGETIKGGSSSIGETIKDASSIGERISGSGFDRNDILHNIKTIEKTIGSGGIFDDIASRNPNHPVQLPELDSNVPVNYPEVSEEKKHPSNLLSYLRRSKSPAKPSIEEGNLPPTGLISTEGGYETVDE